MDKGEKHLSILQSMEWNSLLSARFLSGWETVTLTTSASHPGERHDAPLGHIFKRENKKQDVPRLSTVPVKISWVFPYRLGMREKRDTVDKMIVRLMTLSLPCLVAFQLLEQHSYSDTQVLGGCYIN